MKVYLVYFDNGEAYEDYYEWVEAAFDSEEKAIKYIEDSDFIKRERAEYNGSYVWDRKITEEDPDYPGEEIYYGVTESAWIGEMEVQ